MQLPLFVRQNIPLFAFAFSPNIWYYEARKIDIWTKGGLAIICISNVSKAYGKNKVLEDVSLTVAPGECLGLAGENSCGKTTLISIVAGLIRPDRGSVQVEGPAALVPQQPCLSPDLTLRESLALWYAAHGLPASGIFGPGSPESRLELAPYAHTRVGKLSGGRQKRLAIATALLGSPHTLLLDEPFNMLDLQGRRNMEQLIEEQRAQGHCVLLTAHEPLELSALCDRVALLQGGRVATILDLAGKSPAQRSQQIAHYTNSI